MTIVRQMRKWGILLTLPVFLVACQTDPMAGLFGPIGGAEVDPLIAAGDTRRQAGDLPGAAALYRSAHENTLQDPTPLLRLADTLIALGSYSEAAEAYRGALVLDRSNHAARGLGNALVGLGQPGLALTHYQAALEHDPEDWRSHLGLGVAHDLSGDHDAAILSYEEGLSITPDNTALLNNLALSQALAGKTAPAITILEEVTRTRPEDERLAGTLAIAYALAGREKEAAEIFGRTETPDSVARSLTQIRAIKAISDHARRALAVQTVYTG